MSKFLELTATHSNSVRLTQLQPVLLSLWDIRLFTFSVLILKALNIPSGIARSDWSLLTTEQQEHEVVWPFLAHYFLNLISAFLLIWQLNAGPTCSPLCAETHTHTHTQASLY